MQKCEIVSKIPKISPKRVDDLEKFESTEYPLLNAYGNPKYENECNNGSRDKFCSSSTCDSQRMDSLTQKTGDDNDQKVTESLVLSPNSSSIMYENSELDSRGVKNVKNLEFQLLQSALESEKPTWTNIPENQNLDLNTVDSHISTKFGGTK